METKVEIQNLPIAIQGNAITLVSDKKYHTHPLRLLKNYLAENNVCYIDFSDYKNEDNLIEKSAFVIWLADSLKSVPPEIADRMQNKPLPEGGFIISTQHFQNKPVLFFIGGGLSGLIYAINEWGVNHIKRDSAGIKIPHLDIYETPALPYRFLWTWDHSTNWYLEQCGLQEIGFANPYTKPVSGFLEDYCRLVDFMSLHRINGLTIYGFLRDSHGGIEAAQELCRYASERGVRIFPGVGINCYGGIYWEGEHRFNLTHWLQQNPHLKAEFKPLSHFNLPDFQPLHVPETFYLNAACPSKIQNIDYHVEAIQWLTETFDIGGINFESGDYGTCQCNTCKERRSQDSQWSIKDMAMMYPRLFAAARKNRSDLWLVCEAYWDNLLDREAIAPLSHLPDDAIYQFCVNRRYTEQLKNELTRDYVSAMPRSKNIWRTHMGSQWQQERYTLIAQQYYEMMQLSHRVGLQGATIFGEVSAFSVVNEINYLAFARFAYDANLTWDKFIKQHLAPLLGADDYAEMYLQLLKEKQSEKELHHHIGLAREIASTLSGDAYRRWVWLQNRLYQKLEMQ
jgi:hypothetical protein